MHVIDSHTEGEPTRVIVDGGPLLGGGPLPERLARFAAEFDHVRRFAVNEPRGHDAMVGALLCAPYDASCAAGVIFFNNVGFLGMCGHGTIGLAATLAYTGQLRPGRHRFETPVGIVGVELADDGSATVENVESYRHVRSAEVHVAGLGSVRGDIAWGGNWFFLTDMAPCGLVRANAAELTRAAAAIRDALAAKGVTGKDGALIDHIEMFAPPKSAGANSRNFVLCPGGAYDRSPCGTGTSAKLACLHADGKLEPGEVWIQESLIGSRFRATFELGPNGGVLPRIGGRAFICAESKLMQDPADPFRFGFGGQEA
ncbi:MAG: proline racemase family protein [Hyphomicrobiales bacterium]|nr:proline racemase family protein [Hyphomicrobiales bacterium]MBV8442307.1 proline racemase family protein [Hyphomicrobiales bacterium]